MYHSYSHSLTKWWNAPPYKVVQLSSNFPCGTKLSPPIHTCAATNMGLEILGILKLQMGQMPNEFGPILRNFNNPPPDLKCPFRDLSILATCLYTSVSAETVKLNFCLEF